MNDISYFGETNYRRKFVPFGIRQADRLSHMYVIGQTGVGKSTLIETLAVNRRANGTPDRRRIGTPLRDHDTLGPVADFALALA